VAVAWWGGLIRGDVAGMALVDSTPEDVIDAPGAPFIRERTVETLRPESYTCD